MIFQRFRKSFLTNRSIAKLASQLNEICETLDNKYDINCGGCCYTAYCIAKLLERTKVDFCLTVYDRVYKFSAENKISDLTRSFNHYAIRIKTGTNSYIINISRYGRNAYHKDFKVTSSDILTHYKQNLWNEMYNTANNTKVLTTIENAYYGFTKNLRKE